MNKFVVSFENLLANKAAETYVDNGVKILIAVVVGAMLLSALVLMFQKTILPEATEAVKSLFEAGDYDIAGDMSYSGT